MTVKLIILFSLASFLEVGGAPSWPSWATQVISILMMKLNLSMKKNSFYSFSHLKAQLFSFSYSYLRVLFFFFFRPSRHAQRAQSTQCEQLGAGPHMESVLRNLKKIPENQRRRLQVSSDNRAFDMYQFC